MSGRSALIELLFDHLTCSGVVKNPILIDELSQRWYGRREGDKLVLNLVETAYLLSTGKAMVRVGDRVVETLQDLVSIHGRCFDDKFWPMLSVFKDLRERGRRVRVIEPMKFLVKDKSGELRLVFILEEKYLVSTERLVEIVSEARRHNLKATFAIVSLQGELTYYNSIPVDIKVERDERV